MIMIFTVDKQEKPCIRNEIGNSLVVQWLEVCAFTAKGMGLIPGWGT